MRSGLARLALAAAAIGPSWLCAAAASGFFSTSMISIGAFSRSYRAFTFLPYFPQAYYFLQVWFAELFQYIEVAFASAG